MGPWSRNARSIMGVRPTTAVPRCEPSPHRRIAFITRLNYAGVPNIDVSSELSAMTMISTATMTTVRRFGFVELPSPNRLVPYGDHTRRRKGSA